MIIEDNSNNSGYRQNKTPEDNILNNGFRIHLALNYMVFSYIVVYSNTQFFHYFIYITAKSEYYYISAIYSTIKRLYILSVLNALI